MSSQSERQVSRPLITVVVPVYNGEHQVASILRELERQTYSNCEILIVDDGSTDETAKMAEECAAKAGNARVIRAAHGGPSHARNVGLFEARGEIVFFAESDCVYDDSYIQKAVDKLEEEKTADAVCLTGAPLKVRSTLATECIDIENKVQHRLLNEGRMKPFYAWVFRRQPLVSIGGFDEKLFQGEDKDVFRRFEAAGHAVAWVPGINWRHVRDQTTWELARKWFVRGRSRVLYALKHRLLKDLAKRLLPLWIFVCGALLLPFSPVVGMAAMVFVLVGVFAYSVRTIALSWPTVSRKRFYLAYPLFVLVRNFSTSLGYSVAMLSIALRKVQGREISWDTV